MVAQFVNDLLFCPGSDLKDFTQEQGKPWTLVNMQRQEWTRGSARAHEVHFTILQDASKNHIGGGGCELWLWTAALISATTPHNGTD